MITYSTNWMGPVNKEWYRERGLTEQKTRVLEEDDFLVCAGGYQVGDVLEYDEITTHYCAGRIDIRDDTKEGYDGWNEYSLAPMHGEDWNHLGDWLEDFRSQKLWEFDDLIAHYEDVSERKIRWADDIWYKCLECGLVTDLRTRSVHIHKMDCTRSYDK